VLVHTSNPGSADLQDRDLEGQPLFGRVAEGLAATQKALLGSTGWSSLGVVCGATGPAQACRVREALPSALFLVPGYGAQGASAGDAVRGFRAGPEGLEGGIVNSSRAILFPAAGASTTDTQVWESALDEALQRAIDDLAEAILS
jgi:orotidine-5'-phosphate decarboxylase